MSDSATVLVVDDDDRARQLKTQVLRGCGYHVIETSSGITAIELCSAKTPPDLVLLNVMPPDIEGSDASRRIKAAHPGVVVLQMSNALASPHHRAVALDGGADGFLVEPIEPQELLATAQALLRMRRAEQSLRRLNEHLEQLVAERTRELTEANRRLESETDERRKVEAALWHTQKLEAVGQLTGGIAHDFNNLLAVIVGSTEMIRAALEAGVELPREKMLRLLKTTETATSRASKLTQQLLVFARRSTLTPDIVTIDEVLVACEPFLRRALSEAHVLELTFEPDLWPCRIDAAQFETAILNLVVNANEAMPLGGHLSITTSNIIIDRAAPDAPDLRSGAYVLVRVTDTGGGMDADVAAHAFEPFFTTKEVGKGSGLGLSQVYGFIKQSGGHVAIDTCPGAGTTFRLYLPRYDDMHHARNEEASQTSATPRGDETVLVVEDNPEVLELAVSLISELGYRVLTAVDGPSALAIVRGDEPIDLLFSDVVMPGGIDGFELISQARALRHGLKALATSGYANAHHRGCNRPEVPLLLKPYRRSALAQSIRLALGRVATTAIGGRLDA
jgi:signal transduction histidine kinase